MTENKTRSISICGSSGVMAPGIGTNLISGPISSSPSSIIGSSGGGGGSVSGGSYMMSSSSTIVNPSNVSSGYGNNDSESELGGINDMNVTASGCIVAASADTSSIMNASQISTASNDSVSITKMNINFTHNIVGSSCRFPKLEECAHFHYERVQLGPLSVRLIDDRSDLLNSSVASQSICGDIASSSSIAPSAAAATTSLTNQNQQQTILRTTFYPQTCWFIIKVTPSRSDPFLIKRSFDNLRMLDEMLHRCVYDRKISGLKDLSELEFKNEEDVEYAVAKYLERFSKIASDSLTCGTILTWFQLDNKGRRLPLADTETMKNINTPAVGAAYGVRRYVAQACDEISIEVGDMISVIDMPSPAESIWWRGKKSHLQKSHYEVGFFPQSCVATIGDKVPRHFPLPAPLVGQLDVSPTKPVLRKHGKLIAFFRSFILSRPSRRRLKQTGIYRERVFSCDLSEHLLNSGQEIPMVLKCCAEFIEDNGIVDGIYRLSGITSNIQKLRRAFDEERIPDLGHPEIKQDIHAVSSLLKMYFRELPNPLCTYQLYDNFVEAIQTKSDQNERLRLMKETVLKLPPPHYRTLKYLATHLNKISRHSANTGMTDKNLAIVWAPNLLRSPALESGGVAALRGVGVQAVVTEYLIKNCNLIFDSNEDNRCGGGGGGSGSCSGYDQRMDSLTDCESLLIEQREHDASLSLIERPKSLSVGGAKLISLEEAQERHSRAESYDVNKSIPINAPPPNVGSYIEVGGGPSSLPDKYHTVLPVPRSWQKRKTHSWKSLFSRNPRSSNSNNDMKGLNVSSPIQKEVDSNVPYSGNEANIVDKSHSSIASIQSQQKPKSIDLFESSKPIEVCVRSNSIDSLRTAGHSRSVSHDSYFDLLQSPLRGVATCPSRELSELGLNFDREEPEMRIFSESESLVSSPKVGKENIPPSRRILRARPEEFSSTTNSVNPSPKKQPRLNLLSPSEIPGSTWSSVAEETRQQHDESCCKRYKLEDQLSDIQFIDCSTPEHTIQNQTTVVYASVQVHNPPASLSKGSSFSDDSGEKLKIKTPTSFEAIFENGTVDSENVHARYSYPVLQLTGKRKENDAALKERFSYPGSGNNGGKYVCRMPPSNIKMNIEEEEKKMEDCTTEHHRKNFPQKSDITAKSKNRYSYCDPTSLSGGDITPTISFSILRSNSADLSNSKLQQHQQDIGRSKLSVVTPSSPIQSPHYSLLVGETSSENSSTINTPIFEMDISTSHPHPSNMMTEEVNDEFIDGVTPPSVETGTEMMRGTYNAKDFIDNYIISDDNNCCGNNLTTSHVSHNTTTNEFSNNNNKRDISALKRELSLDLEGGGGGCGSVGSKLTDVSLSSSSANNKFNHKEQQHHQQKKHSNINTMSLSPLNSNITQNTNTNTSDLDTSQSITPSEFGYQHLNRQSNAVSLENSPNTNYDGYENLDQAFINYDNSRNSNLVKSSSSPSSSSSTSNLSPTKLHILKNQLTTPTPTTTTTAPDTVTKKILTPLSCGSVTGTGTVPAAATSPIKATISITYNLKSPIQKKMQSSMTETTTTTDDNTEDYEPIMITAATENRCDTKKPLLETSFDENMVYEQVKFFRTSVSEVNKLLNNGNDGDVDADADDDDNNRKLKLTENENESQIVPELHVDPNRCSSSKNTSSSCSSSCSSSGSGSGNDNKEVNSNLIVLDNDDAITPTDVAKSEHHQHHQYHSPHHHHHHHHDSNDDILMADNIDSLEIDQNNLSLYENVELRKPPIHYENIEITTKDSSSTSSSCSHGNLNSSKSKSKLLSSSGGVMIEKQKSLDNDCCLNKSQLLSSSPPEKQQKRSSSSAVNVGTVATTTTTATTEKSKSTSNFSVKQLATKFETSPVEQLPPFDFSLNGGGSNRASKKFTIANTTSSNTSSSGGGGNDSVINRDAPCYIRAKNHNNKQLNRSNQQITRSLDENAFIREFGHHNRRLQEDVIMMSTKSVQQIEKIDDIRRKSFDFTRLPKTLNPIKNKLPNIHDSHDEMLNTTTDNNPDDTTTSNNDKIVSAAKLKLDLQKPVNENVTSKNNDIKITPTTENRISLIQNNVIDLKSLDDDRSNSPNLSSSASSLSSSTSSNVKVLSGVKLNRERIEQIKEERRHQLSEKYRTESFKSKSKTELREFPKDEKFQSESLRIKSKSRGDVRSLQHRDIDKGTDIMQFSNMTRIRRISDEKNQNNQFEQPIITTKIAASTDNITALSATTATTTTGTVAATIGVITPPISSIQTKFERKSIDFPLSRERITSTTTTTDIKDGGGICVGGASNASTRNSISSTREKISPQFSIRDVTAMFESRSQNQ